MNTLFRNINGVKAFQDDIRLAAKTRQELADLLEQVFKILNDHNIKINKDKCELFADRIEYCSFIIDKNGIHKDSAKFQVIIDMPAPNNITELRSFIGMINYYNRFIRNLSAILYPLYELLRNNNKFVWSNKQQHAFESAKKEFLSDTCLDFFRPTKTFTFSH